MCAARVMRALRSPAFQDGTEAGNENPERLRLFFLGSPGFDPGERRSRFKRFAFPPTALGVMPNRSAITAREVPPAQSRLSSATRSGVQCGWVNLLAMTVAEFYANLVRQHFNFIGDGGIVLD